MKLSTWSCFFASCFLGLVGCGKSSDAPLSNVDGGDGGDAATDEEPASGSLVFAKAIYNNAADEGAGMTTTTVGLNIVRALPDGGFVVGGQFPGSLTLGRGEPEETTLLAVDGAWNTDIFVTAFNADGTLRWARQAGGPSSGEYGWDSVTDLAVFADGAVLIVGDYESPAAFGQGEPNETVLTYEVGSSYVAKFASDGDFLWVQPLETGCGLNGGITRGRCDVDITSSDRIVVGGNFYTDTMVFNAGQENEVVIARNQGSEAGADIFVAQYTSDGEFAWAMGGGGVNNDEIRDIAADGDGGISVLGYYQFKTEFGHGADRLELTGLADGTAGAFLLRIGADGGIVGLDGVSQRVNGDAPARLLKNRDEGWLVLAAVRPGSPFGQEGNTWTTPSCREDSATATALAWFDSDINITDVAFMTSVGRADVAMHEDGSLFVSGAFRDTLTAVLGAGGEHELEVTSEARLERSDGLVARLDPEGNPVWAKTTSAGRDEKGRSVTLLANGTAVVGAGFFGEKTFGVGEPFETTLQAEQHGTYDDSDLFIAGYVF